MRGIEILPGNFGVSKQTVDNPGNGENALVIHANLVEFRLRDIFGEIFNGDFFI